MINQSGIRVQPTEDDLDIAQGLWDYFQLNERLKPADLILVLGSIDTLPAEEGARLFLNGWSRLPYLMFTGGGKGGRFWDRIDGSTQYANESEMLADVAVKMGVPREKILIEPNSTHTKANYEHSKRMVQKLGLDVNSIISVHMPSAERRDKYSCLAAWPEVNITVTSPRVPMRTYHKTGFSKCFDQRDIVTTLVANYQRCGIYGEKGDMVFQPDLFSHGIWEAYEELLARGFEDEMVRDPQTKEIRRNRKERKY
ncbi:MAG: YdcF family protein [Candidatus Pacearchaeota archaeon]